MLKVVVGSGESEGESSIVYGCELCMIGWVSRGGEGVAAVSCGPRGLAVGPGEGVGRRGSRSIRGVGLGSWDGKGIRGNGSRIRSWGFKRVLWWI